MSITSDKKAWLREVVNRVLYFLVEHAVEFQKHKMPGKCTTKCITQAAS
jgi:hypothetical protein